MRTTPVRGCLTLALIVIIGARLVPWCEAGDAESRGRLFGRGGCTRPNSPPIPAVCRVFTPDAKGVFIGSGSVVDVNDEKGAALVLTAWHVIRDATRPISVRFPDGFESGATVLQTDETADLAALAIWTPNGKALVMGGTVRVGEQLTAAGWGPKGCWQSFTGPMTQRVSFDGGHVYEAIEMRVVVREGDSGGPILNSRGELVGVISARNPPITVGSGPVAVGRFLAKILGAKKPAEKPAPEPKPLVPLVPAEKPVPARPAPPVPVERPELVGLIAGLSQKLRQSTEAAEGIGKRLGVVEGILNRAPQTAALAVPGWLSAALPWLAGSAGALTGTGSIYFAVLLGAKLLRWRRKWKALRAAQGAAAVAADSFPAGVAAIPRDTEEAFQFLQLSANEGRSPLHDALIGRLTLDELDKTIESEPDRPQADWARRLKDTLLRRFNQMAPATICQKEA